MELTETQRVILGLDRTWVSPNCECNDEDLRLRVGEFSPYCSNKRAHHDITWLCHRDSHHKCKGKMTNGKCACICHLRVTD